MAEAEIQQSRIDLLTADLKRIDEEVDTATELHQAVCLPLEAELASLEQAAIDRIARREPPDPEADDRRAAIVAEKSQHNADLETVVERTKAMKKPINREIQKLKRDHMSPKVLSLSLAKDGTADPRLLVQRFCNEQRTKWAGVRRDAAVKAIKIVTYNVREIQAGRMTGNLEAQRRRLAGWEAELAEAEAAVADGIRAGDELHQAMIDE